MLEDWSKISSRISHNHKFAPQADYFSSDSNGNKEPKRKDSLNYNIKVVQEEEGLEIGSPRIL